MKTLSDAIDSDGASPEAPDRLSVPPVAAVDPTERVQLRRRPREVVTGLHPDARTVRLAARAPRAAILHPLFLGRHGSVPDAVWLYGRGARPITGFSMPRLNQEVRDAHWDLILDAGRDNLKIPRKLEWSTSPRTREYLNAADSPELELEYFAPVYASSRSVRRVERRTPASRA